MLRLVAIAALCLASVASAQTTLYAEVIGATGSYALGVEQGVLSSADGARRLLVRASAGYERGRFAAVESDYSILAVPVGATASFGLGRPVGIPLAADFGAGTVIVRWNNLSRPRRSGVNTSFAFPVYTETALRTVLADRVALRGGFTVGGSQQGSFIGSARPFLSAGVSL